VVSSLGILDDFCVTLVVLKVMGVGFPQPNATIRLLQNTIKLIL
jgi:hypothetical protein